jgi:predicted house-cleaning noncanonical NTP pyrophosphatase (MazG superfamily)
MKYGKLVRDLVVDLILKKGQMCVYHIATTQEERVQTLGDKLLEECFEFTAAETPEEAVDIDEAARKAIAFYDFDGVALQVARGSPPVYDTLQVRDDERRMDIQFALIEAAEDFVVDPDQRRMAVFLSVFDQAVSFYGFDRGMLEAMRLAKLRERGGFDNWVILDES